ncbi:hypothetical protein WMY93_025501 [Mugilogobius chulae]|uniref:BHLH domain-containing protein n=1 Tax=Mugilogobius chulae TaxID=88201 RepID=A0AAW0N0J8_9GOBI
MLQSEMSTRKKEPQRNLHEQPQRSSWPQGPAEPTVRRKILKPLLEKRRRDRINQSLSRLRGLLLPHTQDGPERRVEKAEILEHTVLFLTGQSSGPPQGPQGPSPQLHVSCEEGFSACLNRATLFLESGHTAPGLARRMQAELRLRSDPRSVSARLKTFPQSVLVLRELKHRRTQSVNHNDAPRAQATAHAHCSGDSGLNKGPSLGPQSLWRPWP